MKATYKLLQTLTAGALLVGSVGVTDAAVIVAAGKVQGTPTFSVQGTLMIIDGPQSDQSGNISGPQGPDWTNDADDGWELLSGTIFAENNRVGWEPDGQGGLSTDIRTGSFLSNNTVGANQARWTFGLPDGAVIHNVYTRWNYQGNAGSGHIYSYNEGSLTQFLTPANSSTVDLSLQVIPSNAPAQNISFQRIFAGDITVAGGDGFALTFATGGGGFANIDAVVIDYTAAIPEPSSLALLALGGLGLLRRRR